MKLKIMVGNHAVGYALVNARDKEVLSVGAAGEVRESTWRRRSGSPAVPGSDHPEAALSAGLGGSLVEALRGQRRWKVALVHTLHPLFWIWTRKAGTRPTGPTVLAGHPEGSIVGAFTQKVLRARWSADEAPSVLHFPAGSTGDHQRLEALTSGVADAAVLGSAFAPSALSRLGLTDSLFFGVALKFPTAGVAVDVARTSVDHPSVRKVVAAQTAAIAKVKSRDPVALDAVASLLHDNSRTDAQHACVQHFPTLRVVDRVRL
jgi:hypothetical protein